MTQQSFFSETKQQVTVKELPGVKDCFNCDRADTCTAHKEGARGCGDLFPVDRIDAPELLTMGTK